LRAGAFAAYKFLKLRRLDLTIVRMAFWSCAAKRRKPR
jgi:hypothetical protein